MKPGNDRGAAPDGPIDDPEESIEAVLRRIGVDSDIDRLTLGELLASLDRRAYGFVLLLLAVPNLTPGPSIPGFSTVFGLPAIAFALQMVAGRGTPWLPPRLARIAIPRRPVIRMIARALPLVVRLDRVLRPRLIGLVSLAGHRWTGLAVLIQAILLALPLPIYSLAPAFALLLIALGMIARDGLVLALGHFAGVGAIGVGIALVLAARELLALV